MAQSKAQKAKAGKAKVSPPTKAKAKAARKPKGASSRAPKKPQTKTKRAKPKSRSASPSDTRSSDKKAVREAVGKAENGAGAVASKARVPLLAGGAAIAGTIGGVVIGATRSGGKVLGVQLPRPRRVTIRSKDLAKAAKELGRFAENAGELAAEVKRTREGLGNGNGKHNSPLEVLLRGLTDRR